MEFGAVSDGSPMTKVDNGMASCIQNTRGTVVSVFRGNKRLALMPEVTDCIKGMVQKTDDRLDVD